VQRQEAFVRELEKQAAFTHTGIANYYQLEGGVIQAREECASQGTGDRSDWATQRDDHAKLVELGSCSHDVLSAGPRAVSSEPLLSGAWRSPPSPPSLVLTFINKSCDMLSRGKAGDCKRCAVLKEWIEESRAAGRRRRVLSDDDDPEDCD
jgi:hypothetical protein